MGSRLLEKKRPNVVVRPDTVIEAKFDLTPKQSDIIDFILLQLTDDDNTSFEIKVTDMAKYYDDGLTNIYRDMEQVAVSMQGKGFVVADPKGRPKARTYFAWFSMIEYVPLEAKIVYNIDKDLKKLLIEAKRGILYNPKYSIGLTSKYSKRMYYMLKLYLDTKIRIDDFEEFLAKMECPERYAQNIYDFKVRVMEVAKKEIEEKTDIKFTYRIEKNKAGKRTIIMNVSPNERVVTQCNDIPTEVIDLFLNIEDVSVSDIKVLWVESNFDYDRLKSVVDEVCSRPYKNFMGYVISGIRNKTWGNGTEG